MSGTLRKGKESMEARVLDFIRKKGLAPVRGKLLVAVSGGTDSVCLLHVLNIIKSELGISLHAAHLNHMLRGPESNRDAAFVKKLCNKLRIPCTIESRNVRDYQKETGCSLEEAARNVRYAFFHETALKEEMDTVATAHTADDQAETVLLHLIRGSGLRGLRGMQPLSYLKAGSGDKLKVVRPLLEIKRIETEAYCRKYRLAPRQDSSNKSPVFLRNRIRHELIPLLEKYNPSVKEALLRTGHLLEDDYNLVEGLANPLWSELAHWEGPDLVLERKILAAVHPGLQRALLRRALEEFLGSLKDVETTHVEQMRSGILEEVKGNKIISLAEGVKLVLDYKNAILSYDPGALCPLPSLDGQYPVKIPGETGVSGWMVKATELAPENVSIEQDDRWRACFDRDKLVSGLMVRARRRGDRFQPLGLSSPQKLQDFMVNSKISRLWRDRVPLVTSGEDIIWVAGWRISELFKVTSQTRNVLCLEFKSTDGEYAFPI